MINWLDKIFNYLQDHPLLGMFTSVTSGAIGLSAGRNPHLATVVTGDHDWMESITPYLSFFALGVGALVGVLTLALKWMQIIEKIQKKRKEKRNKK